jgi:hypothetical protein
MAIQDRSSAADLAKLNAQGLSEIDILWLILCELRVHTQVLAEGLNVQSDLDSYRNDFIQPN